MLSRESISLGDALLRAAAAGPERDAVVLPGERWSYGRLAERAQGIARSLAALGVARGDRVAVLMPNSAECLAALFGTALAGATVVPINARFKAPEMRHILADSGAKVVLTSDLMDVHSNLSDQLRAATTEVPIVLLGAKVEEGLIGEAEFDALGVEFERPQSPCATPRCCSTRPARPRSRAAAGFRTRRSPGSGAASPTRWTSPRRTRSGTRARCSTSRPSASRSRASSSARRTSPPGTSIPARASSCSPPSARASGIRPTTGSARHRQPPALRRDRPEQSQVRARGRSAGHAAQAAGRGTGGRARLDIRHDRERGLRGHRPRRRSGAGADGDRRRPGGRIEGLEARLAEDGEILLRGPLLFDGYHNEAGRSPFVDGWFHTGDLGASVHDRITFRGRKKEMLRVGGENVAPRADRGDPDGPPGGADRGGHRHAPTSAWTRSRTRSSSCAPTPPRRS